MERVALTVRGRGDRRRRRAGDRVMDGGHPGLAVLGPTRPALPLRTAADLKEKCGRRPGSPMRWPKLRDGELSHVRPLRAGSRASGRLRNALVTDVVVVAVTRMRDMDDAVSQMPATARQRGASRSLRRSAPPSCPSYIQRPGLGAPLPRRGRSRRCARAYLSSAYPHPRPYGLRQAVRIGGPPIASPARPGATASVTVGGV